jgi:hypothetical protein
MEYPQRLFTPEEANDLLPYLKPLLEDMLHVRDRLLEIQPELQPTLEKAIHNGNSSVSGAALKAMKQLKEVIMEIRALGVEVKDVNRGLIDFPSIRDGELIYLCWAYHEKQVAYWHRMEEGFAGRRPILD